MNQYYQPPIKKPNPKLSIKDYHHTALKLLDEMYEENRARLRKIRRPESDAWVQREDWKTRLKYELRCRYEFASAIEESLLKDGIIRMAGSNTYVERVPVPAQDSFARYWCKACQKYKGIAAQQYVIDERVNFTLAGFKGQPATNQLGKVVIGGKLLVLEYAGRTFNRSCEDVTPMGAPWPLLYCTHGKCWCALEGEQP